MSKKKVCMFFNDLALYRKAIYKMLDEEYDCDWYIEDADTGVKEFNPSELHHVERLSVKNIGPFYRTKGLRALLKKDYDIYFMLGATRNLSLFSFCLLKRILYSKKRVYFWTHGYYGKENWFEKTLWKRPLLKMADGLFTYGDYAKKLLEKDGFNENRIFPIHNSLDYDRQIELRKQLKSSTVYTDKFGNANPVILFIGRLSPVKQLDLLVEAIGLLHNYGKEYNLVFVGDGDMKDHLSKQVAQNGLADNTWFYGACYDERKNAELIYNADLCVAPGNIGLTAIHVLMFGCPAISHNDFSWQMPEFEAIHPGKTGDFFKRGNAESLTEVIDNWFAEHKSRREETRENCYKEIDTNWNPYYQINLIKSIFNNENSNSF